MSVQVSPVAEYRLNTRPVQVPARRPEHARQSVASRQRGSAHGLVRRRRFLIVCLQCEQTPNPLFRRRMGAQQRRPGDASTGQENGPKPALLTGLELVQRGSQCPGIAGQADGIEVRFEFARARQSKLQQGAERRCKYQ